MEATSRRATNKERTRHVIEAAAWRLFARDGFDQVTVDDIAAAADVAPRTFFRYFETKEAVLYGDWRNGLAEFCTILHDRPADEAPLTALLASVSAVLNRLEEDTTELLQRARIAKGSQHSGHYAYSVVQPATVDAIADVLAQRLDVDVDSDLRPRLYARMVTIAIETARDSWLATGGRRSFTSVLEDVFAELGGSISPRS
jgi:AcrR family transcriptional regulator